MDMGMIMVMSQEEPPIFICQLTLYFRTSDFFFKQTLSAFNSKIYIFQQAYCRRKPENKTSPF